MAIADACCCGVGMGNKAVARVRAASFIMSTLTNTSKVMVKDPRASAMATAGSSL